MQLSQLGSEQYGELGFGVWVDGGVVDDEQSVLKVSSIVFKEQGCEVRTARDGFEALGELRRSMPDLIVSDLTMPNMSGFEILSIVRRRFPHIPVVAISGQFEGDSPTGLISDAFFTKGQYQPEELFRKIAELIEQSPMRPNFDKTRQSTSLDSMQRRRVFRCHMHRLFTFIFSARS